MKGLIRMAGTVPAIRRPFNAGFSLLDQIKSGKRFVLRAFSPNSIAAEPQGPQLSAVDFYVKSVPSPQNALDIFKGEWASQLPKPLDGLTGGYAELFEDPRIEWGLDRLGGVQDKDVLELGPLEGGHSYMLQQRGAASVTAIEANTRAYLKCLIVKELLGLDRVKFLCGDFVAYLRTQGLRFDLCAASGVLYHMKNPAELIGLAAKASDRLYIWTHYYDHGIISSNPKLAHKFSGPTAAEYDGFRHTLYRQDYKAATSQMGFCGGGAEYSHWMTREEILACLRNFGFGQVETNFDAPDHPNGPSFSLVAVRDALFHKP